MEKLTKIQLAWIYDALIKEADRQNGMAMECNENSPASSLCALRRDNLKSTAEQIKQAFTNNSKRIAIV